jgi:hypothetical protein
LHSEVGMDGWELTPEVFHRECGEEALKALAPHRGRFDQIVKKGVARCLCIAKSRFWPRADTDGWGAVIGGFVQSCVVDPGGPCVGRAMTGQRCRDRGGRLRKARIPMSRRETPRSGRGTLDAPEGNTLRERLRSGIGESRGETDEPHAYCCDPSKDPVHTRCSTSKSAAWPGRVPVNSHGAHGFSDEFPPEGRERGP